MLLGFHHVTAFAGDAQRNLDFYRGLPGLHLVKRTVNFDDPAQHHFYFGDARGTPGTLLTFFPWPSAPASPPGSGQIANFTLAVSEEFMEEMDGIEQERFGERWTSFRDPAGLEIELVARDPDAMRLHSLTLREADPKPTVQFLTVLGFSCVGVEQDRTRMRLAHADQDTLIDIVHTPGLERRRLSAGRVHHVAFRAAEDAAQEAWREKLKQAGARVTRVIDRRYFHSIYFREPGGALFEIATDGPGFFVDETELGSGLRLPPWLDTVRESIERRLPAVKI